MNGSQEMNEAGNQERVDKTKAGVTHKKGKNVNSERANHLLNNALNGRVFEFL